ncbi:MAG TPA: GTPase Era [Gammaproteobacteria bacterium]|nr:GTPase Era [Gammaproteobacteria bacterium]
MRDNIDTVCGYAAIVGRPNVGKSTLLNHILGEKLSITSRKPQTTRHRLLGVKTVENAQAIYVDTPGMHIEEAHLLNKFMNKEARRALVDVDVIIFVVDSLKWNAEDQLVFELVAKAKCPIILAVNKVDTLLEKTALLPYCESLALKFRFAEIIPLSATHTTNIEALERAVARYLPKSPHYFPEEQITDRTPRFRMAEIIREKLVRSLGEELPYSTTVEIEMYKSDKSEKVPLISAIIWVERDGQKPIVIGKNGERLKEIGIRSRKDIEKIVGRQVHLKLWVKVRGGWSDDERALKSLGYIDLE